MYVLERQLNLETVGKLWQCFLFAKINTYGRLLELGITLHTINCF